MVRRSITPVNSYLTEQKSYRAGQGKKDNLPRIVRNASGRCPPVNSYLAHWYNCQLCSTVILGGVSTGAAIGTALLPGRLSG